MTFNLPIEYLIGTAIGIALLIVAIVLHKKVPFGLSLFLLIMSTIVIKSFCSIMERRQRQIETYQQSWETGVQQAIAEKRIYQFGIPCPKCKGFVTRRNILELSNDEYRWGALCTETNGDCGYFFIMKCPDGTNS